jgi:hypothetical protein
MIELQQFILPYDKVLLPSFYLYKKKPKLAFKCIVFARITKNNLIVFNL